jgi:hypothetical protein
MFSVGVKLFVIIFSTVFGLFLSLSLLLIIPYFRDYIYFEFGLSFLC